MAMTDDLPPYLLAQRREIPVEPLPVCRHQDDDDRDACDVCLGTGVVLPRPELSDEAKALGCELLPHDHLARLSREYVPTRPGSGSRAR